MFDDTTSARRRAVCITVPTWPRAAAAVAAFSLTAAAQPPEPPPEPTTTGFSLFGEEAAPLTEPLITDRPDFTESADAVPRGHIQLEMGYTFTYDREDGDRLRDHTAPEFLARIGLVDRLELRLGWDGYSWQNTVFEAESSSGRAFSLEDNENGSNDVSIGFKYKIRDQDGPWPHLGVIGELALPSGSAGLTTGDVEPAVILAWAYDLGEQWALAGNVGIGGPRDEGTRFAQATGSVALGYAIDERWGAYAEYFGLYPNAEGSDCAHNVNGGLTYLVTDNFQLDVRVGAGLNEEADDFFAGAGFAWRW